MSTYSKYIRPFLIVAALLIAGIGIFAVQFLGALNAQSAGGYSLDMIFQAQWDTWACPGYSAGNCGFSCDAANAGRWCYSDVCSGGYVCDPGFPPGDPSSNCGNLTHTEYICNAPACAPDPSCAASTCDDSTCTDSCGNVHTGTKSCPMCDPGMGGVCSSAANACGDTGAGTIQCDGSCNAVAPAPVDACPSDAGVQCNVSECSPMCDPGMGGVCSSAANACGDTGAGTIQCDGSCDASVPVTVDACSADPGLQCSGPCICDPSTGNTCALSNACGVSGLGTIQCDSSCDAVPPAPIDVCPAPGLQCSGPCIAPPPDPGLTLTTNKTSVRKDEVVTLTWASAAVVIPSDWSCKVFGPGGVASSSVILKNIPTGGPITSGPIAAKSEFILSCTHNPSNTTFTSTSVKVETTGDIQEI